MKILTVCGPCLTGDCNCRIYDKGEVVEMPPYHAGCTCYVTGTDDLVNVGSVVEFMKVTENEHSSGRLWWDMLKDWLEEQRA